MSGGEQCSIVQVGGFRPSGDPFASHFGLRPLAAAGESWPAANGKPLLFVCQMNLTAAPAVPLLLKDIALITFFVDPELGDLAKENKVNWSLCAYPSLNGLLPLNPPDGAPKLSRGFECRWELADDDAEGTKIGGEASEIQSEPWWDFQEHPSDPTFCLQINSEEKVSLAWGDAGTVYLARGTAGGCEDQWFLDWQCY